MGGVVLDMQTPPGDDRAELVWSTFVELADTLVAGFDVIEFLGMLAERSKTLLRAAAAGVLLADPQGNLRLAAASCEQARIVELFELDAAEGPCLEAFRTGQPCRYVCDGSERRWKGFCEAASRSGYSLIEALPMRLRDQRVGALNLFRDGSELSGDTDMRIGQALADIATIGLLQERTISFGNTLAVQLQSALNSRIVIEQAKGKLAERLGIGPEQAFGILRDHARSHNRKLSELCAGFVAGTESVSRIVARRRRQA